MPRCARGSRLPLLVRFADILRHRLARLQGAFAQAMREWDYAGGYTAVYPVKVNQQKGVAGELARAGGDGFGLEAGSKPELMAVLALARPGSIVICNGYKDREYLRLALIGRKLGLRVFIVIEKPSELKPALEEAQGARRRTAVRRARAPDQPRRRQVAEHRRREIQVRPDAAPAADPDRRAEGRESDAVAATAARVHGLADFQRARHRRRHARGDALLCGIVQTGNADRLRRCRRRPRRRLRRHALAFGLLDQLRPRSIRGDRSCSRWPKPAPSTASRRRT